MRNLKRKIGYGIASLVLSLALFGGGVIGMLHPSAQNRKAEKTEHLVVCKQRNYSKKAKKIKKGQKFYFGRYEQDGDRKNPNSHAAVVGLSLDMPVLYAANHACDIIMNGSIITLDAESGLVYAT